ncbi:MAG: pilus assembly PilX N-terminal domain-containing protein [Thermoanaerobaculia bacterium]
MKTTSTDSRLPSLAGLAGRRQDLRSQAGSAYIVTLLALVVLTIVGLSLSLITQSEMLIGSNERTIQRIFYAADSGLSESTARALVNADHASRTLELDEIYGNPLLALGYRIEVSPFYPILDSPCNLCEINNRGTYSDEAFRKVNHAATATATRIGGPDESILAQKTVSAMVEVQPWRWSPEAVLSLDDPTELEKIKF